MLTYCEPLKPCPASASVTSMHPQASSEVSTATELHGPRQFIKLEAFEDLLCSLPTPTSTIHKGPALLRPCILVVDDDQFDFDLLEDVFGAEYEVLFATDGLTALRIATDRSPDLILLDVVMPRLDGYEVCRRLKARHETSKIPVIFVSGLSNMSSETTALELGAVDYITKPINALAVKMRVNNQIQHRAALHGLLRATVLEKELRADLLAVLESRNRDQPIH